MANTWPRGQPRKELNSLNRWSTPLSLLVIVTLLPAVQLARSSVSSSIGEASWVVHQLHVCPWKVTSAPGLRTGEKTGKVCELHKYVRIHLLRNSRQTSGFSANAPSSLYISRGLWDRLSLSISFGTAQQEGSQPAAGPHGRSRCPGDTSSLRVSLPANAWNGDLRFDLGRVRASSRLCPHGAPQKQLPTEGSETSYQKESCSLSLRPVQNPTVFHVVTPNSHSLREGRMKPCSFTRMVCSEQRSKHRLLLVGKTPLVLSPHSRFSEQLLETKLACLVSARVFWTAS